jgi:hypothetical protein
MSAINVTLGLNAARFRSGAAAAAGYAKQFSSTIRASMLSALGPIALAMEAFNFLKQTFQEANQIADISQRMGVGTDALQRVAFAARKVGIELDAVGGLLKGIQRGFAGAFTSASKTSALQDLGFSMEEIQAGGVDAQIAILRLSEGYDKAGNKAEYLAKLQQAFGRASFDLMGILSMSTDELRASFQEATVMSKNSIQAADDMGDAFNGVLDGMKVVGMGLVAIFGLIIGAIGTFVGSAVTYFAYFGSMVMQKIVNVATFLEKVANKLGVGWAAKAMKGVREMGGQIIEVQSTIVDKAGGFATASAGVAEASWRVLTGGEKKEGQARTQRRQLGDVEEKEDKQKKGKSASMGISSMAVIGGGGLVGGAYDPSLTVQKEMLEVQKQLLNETKKPKSGTPTITN